MIKLSHMRLKNFKSFRKAEMPIADGFTVIAGSNGSGKSNLLDALMFGFGITSLKMLRASRLTDLVNYSSNEGYAKCDIVLREKENDKKFEISRMVDKQGKSVYRLDSEKKTLNEISSLLGELGIKPAGHNIVVQGDITRIMEMSSQQRREIIDEVAGLSEFDEKKEEALKELEKVDSRIKEAGIVLKEREKYLEELDAERKAAMEFGSLESEKKQAKATIIFGELERVLKAKTENDAKILRARSEKSEIEAKISELAQELSGLAAEEKALEEALLKASEKTYSEIGVKLEEKKAKKGVLEEKVRGKSQAMQRNESEIERLEKKASALLEERRTLEEETQKIESALPKLRQQAAELKNEKAALDKKISEKESSRKQLEREKKEIDARLAEGLENLHKCEIDLEREKKWLESVREKLEAEKARAEGAEKKAGHKRAFKARLSDILRQTPDPEEALESNFAGQKKSIEKLKQLEAAARQAEKAVLELKKDISSCPVCEKPLELERKKILLEKRLSEKKLAEQEMEKEKALLEQAEKSRQRLRQVLDEVAGHREKVFGLEELEAELSAATKNIEALNSTLSGKSLAEKEARMHGHARNLDGHRKAMHQKQAEIDAFFSETSYSKAGELASRIAQLERQVSLDEQKQSGIQNERLARLDSERKGVLEEISAKRSENSSAEEQVSAEGKSIGILQSEISDLQDSLKKAQKESEGMAEKRKRVSEKAGSFAERIETHRQRIKKTEQVENQVIIENSRLEVRENDLKEESKLFEGTKPLERFDLEELKRRVPEIEKRIQKLGAINMRAVASFEELKKEVSDITEKSGKLEQERLAVLDMIGKIEVKRTNVFMDCFSAINKNFNRLFYSFFSGAGNLSLSNPENPLEAGLIIQAKHKEALQNIDSMSGGEKSLTALAFLFAIQLYEPAPFYVFDEADAALDAENSIKLGRMIKEISKTSQFLAITHNEQLIKQADQIIGVALNKEKSSVIGIRLKQGTITEAADTQDKENENGGESDSGKGGKEFHIKEAAEAF
ncbi:MAG: AAA family ATPase [Candidatus Diapherotrites archaeon]|nr:AAA family ATPase [Candidatus Diapherotrites archaeon]